MPSKRSPRPVPPILAYIAKSQQDEAAYAEKRRAAEVELGRLYQEQAALIAQDRAASAAITAANAAVVDAAAIIANIEGGGAGEGEISLPTARARLAAAHSALDDITRAAAARVHRLAGFETCIEQCEARRDAAARALLTIRRRCRSTRALGK